MNPTPRILTFAGSLRVGSLNKQLARIGSELLREAGVEVTLIDLADYPMPLYNQDDETAHGLPEAARRFKKLLCEHDGFLIASPEYNSGYSGVLKNAIDWASRTESDDEPPLLAFAGKTAALVAASPGGLGGLRGLVVLRMLLGNIGVHLLPDQIAIPNASNAFDAEGRLADAGKQAQLAALTKRFGEFTAKLMKRSTRAGA